MGCTPCQQKAREREAALKKAQEAGLIAPEVVITISDSCGYTVSQLHKWKEALDCAYNKGILSEIGLDEQGYGYYIGVINHTQDHINDNACEYREQLNQLLTYIHKLVILGC